MHRLEALECIKCSAYGTEPQRSRNPLFDEPMVLLNNVVQVRSHSGVGARGEVADSVPEHTVGPNATEAVKKSRQRNSGIEELAFTM